MVNIKALGLAAAATLAGCLTAGLVSAQAVQLVSDPPRQVLQYPSSLLSSDAGVRRLYHRLQVAAEEVCPRPVGILVSNTISECREQAVQAAVARIHNARLADLANRATRRG